MKRKGLLALLLSIVAIHCFAYDFVSDGIYYNYLSLEDKTVEVTYYSTYSPSYSGDFTIPSLVNYNDVEYRVVGIGANAFYNCIELTSVNLPENIISIGDYAFCFTAIKNIKIPDGVRSIGKGAFRSCYSLESIIIPDYIKEIEGVFTACSSLVSISLPKTLKRIGDETFSGCTKLSSITIPDSVYSIGNNAFYNNVSLTSFILPQNLNIIGNQAFYNCQSLFEIEGLDKSSIIEIGYNAFKETAWYNSLPNGIVYIGDYLYNYKGEMPDNTLLVIKDGIKTIGKESLYNCKNLTSISIPSSVIKIGNTAFGGCTGLTSIILPNSITEIGEQAFAGCYNLSEITLPDNIKRINGRTFIATKIKSIKIPLGVTYIGDNAFCDCSLLTSIFIPEGVDTIGLDAFHNTKIKSLTIPSTVSWIGDCGLLNYLDTLYWNSPITPESFFDKFNGTYQTYNSKPLRFLKIGEGMTYLRGFGGCARLDTVILPESLRSIGYGAFDGCSSLTSLYIPSGVTNIEGDAFLGCNNLKITGCEGLTYIGDHMYLEFPYETSQQEGLVLVGKVLLGYNGIIPDNTVLEIPEGVTQIARNALSGRKGLISVKIPESVSHISYGAFSGSGIKNINIPEGLNWVEMYAFSDCINLQSIELPSSFSSVEDGLFSGCTNLRTVVLPRRLSYISSQAFENCVNLSSLTLLYPGVVGASLEDEWGSFKGVDLSKCTLYVPEECVKIYKETPGWNKFANITTQETIPFVDNIGYKVISEEEKTVKVVSVTDNTVDIIIPNTVQLNGVDYNVIKIDYAAFEGSKNLKTVLISEGITEIDDFAFYSCDLESITIPSSLIKIGRDAFSYGNLKSIITYKEDPTQLFIEGGLTRWEEALDRCVIYVPDTSIDLYKSTDPWNYFNHIEIGSIIRNGLFYEILSNEQKTAILVDLNQQEEIVMPDFILYDNNEYNVVSFKDGLIQNNQNITSIALSNNILELDEGAFSGCTKLKKIILPQNITTISPYTFRACVSLDSICLPENLNTLGNYAFAGCTGLTSIIIPDAVTYIGTNVFAGCTGIKKLDIPSAVVSIGASAFENCTGLNVLSIPASLTQIDNSAFRGCLNIDSLYWNSNTVSPISVTQYCNANLKWFELGNSVTFITDRAFGDCVGLTTIKIPANINTIAQNAFTGCANISEITVDSANIVYDSRDNSNAIIETASNTLIYASNSSFIPVGIKVIGENAFEGRAVYTALEIPEGVVEIKANAFKNCSGIKGLSIPSSINQIGNRAFDGCPAIDSLWWESNVTPYHVTQYCKQNLKHVSLGNNVTVIGDNAFTDCAGLTELIVPDSVTSIGISALYGCIGISSINLPDKLESISNGAFNGCTGLSELVIPEHVISIGDGAFANCSNLRTLTIPASLEYLNDQAFINSSNIQKLYWNNSIVNSRAITQHCKSNLKYVEFGEDITQLGDYAFYDCVGLTSITLPEGVTTIPTAAFAGCVNLNQVTLPEQLVNINDRAFAQCSALRDIALSANLNTIGEYAFADCSSLSAITIPESVSNIGRSAFAGCYNVSSVSVPSSVIEVGVSAFMGGSIDSVYWNSQVSMRNVLTRYASESLRVVVLGNEVNEVHPEEFSGCAVLSDITIPEGVIKIGNNAFYGCNSLKSIILPSSLNTIGDNAFDECRNLGEVYCYAINCPTAELNTFRNVKATAFVPLESVFKYRAESPWSGLNLILPFCFNETEQVTLSNDGYATFYCSYADYELSTGLSAYVVTGVENGKIVYETLSEGKFGGVIPQGVAVMIKSDKKSADTYDLKFNTSNFTYNGNNLLLGSDVDTITYAYRTSDFYKLSYGPTGTELEDVFGWYWGVDDGGAFRIDGHKAWLATPKQTVLRAPSFSMTRGAIFVDTPNPSFLNVIPEGIYDMSGRKVDIPLNNGLYIIDGKQVLISE